MRTEQFPTLYRIVESAWRWKLIKVNAKKVTPRKRKLIVLLAALFLLLITALISCTYALFAPALQQKVAIIEKPAVIQEYPTVEEDLEPIIGTPKDIGEDYVVDVIEQTAEPIYLQPVVDDDVINILIVGTDVNGVDKGARSDSMLLLSYSKAQKTAKLTSFMRDVWIHIPDYGMNRLNAAFAFGGVGLLINTINDNFDLDIQYYVTIDFERFKNIVDELGGIEVRLSDKETRLINTNCRSICDPLPEEDSIQLLNGAQTLTHCRNRSTGGGDFDRTKRQREVMFSIFERVKVETNVTTLSDLLFSTIGYVKTNLSIDKLLEIGLSAVTAESLSMEQGRIPFDNTWNYANKDGRSVIEINRIENRDMLHTFLYENGADPLQYEVMSAEDPD